MKTSFSGSGFRIILMAKFWLVFVIALRGTEVDRQHNVHRELFLAMTSFYILGSGLF
jgi:hypothetical protein